MAQSVVAAISQKHGDMHIGVDVPRTGIPQKQGCQRTVRTYAIMHRCGYSPVLTKGEDAGLVLGTVIVWHSGVGAEDGFIEVGTCDAGIGYLEGLDCLRTNDNFATSCSVEASHRWVKTWGSRSVNKRLCHR